MEEQRGRGQHSVHRDKTLRHGHTLELGLCFAVLIETLDQIIMIGKYT